MAVLFGGNSNNLLVSILGGLTRNFNSEINLILNGAVILGPVVGVLIIFVSRFFAESLKVFAAIANNTKETAVNIKNNANERPTEPDSAAV